MMRKKDAERVVAAVSVYADSRDERIAELEAALAAIHATSRRVTHEFEWYLDGVRQSPGTYVVMRVGDASGASEHSF